VLTNITFEYSVLGQMFRHVLLPRANDNLMKTCFFKIMNHPFLLSKIPKRIIALYFNDGES